MTIRFSLGRLPAILLARALDMRMLRLRDKLILASLVMIVPFIVWNVIIQIMSFRQDYDQRIAAHEEIARDVADVFTAHIHHVAAVQRTIATGMWGKNRLPKLEFDDYLAASVSSLECVAHLCAAGPDGIVFASDVPLFAGRDWSHIPEVRRVMNGADWVLGDVWASPMNGQRYFSVVTGVRRDGELLGMMIGLTAESVVEDALRGNVMDTEQLVVTDSKGVVALVHGQQDLSWPQRQWQNQPCVRQALEGRTATVQNLRMPDGEIMLGTAVPIKQLGWTAGVFSPREEVIGPGRREILANSLIALLLTGFMVGVAVFIGNRIADPVVDLARTEREFGQGNLDARAEIHTHDELESLGDSFNEMASALQERTAQLNATLDTAHHQSERSEALYAVAQGLIVSMDLDERLEIIGHALASMVRVKRSSIFLRKGNRLVGAAGWNLMHPETFQDLVYDFSVGGRLIEEALAEGAPILVPDVREDYRIDPWLLGILDGFDVRALIALPLMRRNHLVGLVILDNPGEYAEFDPEGVENARRLGDLAAIAIENAQVFEKERNVAHALQTSMLPQFCGRAGNFSFACEYHAALEIAQLGGDLYDLIELDDGRIGIVVADVSGKGLEAAVFTAMSKYTLRAFAHEDPEPARVLARANGSLVRAGGDWGFVTMAYSVLDMADGRLVSANAGHPPYVHVTALGEVSELRTHVQNPPLGVFGNIDYVQTHHRMELGDVLVGYTDGVSGARRDGESFEVERLARVISAHRYLTPEEIARAIYKAVLDYSQGSLQDDVALVVVKRDAQ